MRTVCAYRRGGAVCPGHAMGAAIYKHTSDPTYRCHLQPERWGHRGSGYILTGPEYTTVFAGDTGKELATVDYPVPRGSVSAWGDAYGKVAA